VGPLVDGSGLKVLDEFFAWRRADEVRTATDAIKDVLPKRP